MTLVKTIVEAFKCPDCKKGKCDKHKLPKIQLEEKGFEPNPKIVVK